MNLLGEGKALFDDAWSTGGIEIQVGGHHGTAMAANFANDHRCSATVILWIP
jgi:hypothetical protein